MMEVGPWRMDGKGGFKTQEGGWEEYMTMVYGEVLFQILSFTNLPVVDQPAGTGFSLASTDHFVHTSKEVRVFHELRQIYAPYVSARLPLNL
jgi:carboxypeptidase D